MARVMIVDDDLTGLKACRALLESEGIEVLTACDPIQADTLLDIAHPSSIDLILLDVGLPICPGDEIALAYHKDRRPDNPQMKIVLYSGLPEEDLMAKARDAFADGYIVKGSGDLIAKVKGYLAVKR